jgi:hypothetical protein
LQFAVRPEDLLFKKSASFLKSVMQVIALNSEFCFQLSFKRLDFRNQAIDFLTRGMTSRSAGRWSFWRLSEARRRINLDAVLQRTHQVLARDHADEPQITFDHRHASEPMIDHELKHPGQLRFCPDIDELWGHDVRNSSLHQIVVARDHVSRGKDEAGKVVELRNQSHHLRVFLDRKGIEVFFFEQVTEFPQRDAARHGPGVPRHGAASYLFEELVQGAIRSVALG